MERLKNRQATLWLVEGWDLNGCGAALEWEAERKNGQIRGSLGRRHQE